MTLVSSSRQHAPASITSPCVAVILVNYNSGALLHRTLSLLALQTVKPRRVIVIDNESRDGSAFGLEDAYDAVELISPGSNVGFAAANNLGIARAADCEWIALLNVDAFPEATWLEELLVAAVAHPECSFFGSRLVSATDPQTLDGTGDVYHVSGRVWRRDRGASSIATDEATEGTVSPCAAAALFRRTALLAVGGFDESYFCFLEDVDLGLRLRLAGYSYSFAARSTVYHVGSALSGSESDFSIYYGHRNLVWTYVKNMPWPLFWFYLPQHLALNLLTTCWFILRGRAQPILRAKWDALRGLPRILRLRRLVQSSRSVGYFEVRSWLARGLLRPYAKRPR